MSGFEGSVLWQGNREFGAEDIAYIRMLIQRFPRLPRSELADTLCEHLGWLTPAGAPKTGACRKLLARLEAGGEIRLPARRQQGGERTAGRQRAAPPRVPVLPGEPVQCALAALGPVRVRLLGQGPEVAECNAYLERFHPLGYRKPFGYWARYRIEAAERSLGYLLLGGAARAIAPRDRWIGWSARQRLANLPWVVNNSRFLAFPGFRSSIWPAMCWASWHASWPLTGRRAGATGRCCWRALSIPPTIAAPATALPAGSCWGTPAAAVWRAPASTIRVRPS